MTTFNEKFNYTLEYYEDSAGEFRWRLVAKNGNVVADSSEGYANREDCRDIAEKIFLTNFTPETAELW